MKAKQVNSKSGRKTFLIIGLLVAVLVMLQSSNWNTYLIGSFAQEETFSTDQVKSKVMFFGRVTKSVLDSLD